MQFSLWLHLMRFRLEKCFCKIADGTLKLRLIGWIFQFYFFASVSPGKGTGRKTSHASCRPGINVTDWGVQRSVWTDFEKCRFYVKIKNFGNWLRAYSVFSNFF